MDIIRPVNVTDSVLVATNITEDDYAEWNSATNYVLGDKVIVVSTHRIYEAAQNNTNQDPTQDDGTNWIDIGATNRWKAFDKKIGDPVTNTTVIEYTLRDPTSNPTAIALFGMKDATTANVTVTDLTTGGDGEVYNRTLSLIDNQDVVDWYTYFFEAISYKDQELFTGIPPYLGAQVEVTVSGVSGDTISLGQIVFGFQMDLGLTNYGTSISIEDYSRKETDTFGNFIVIERAFAKLVDFDVQLPTEAAARLQRTLAQYRATPIVFIGSESAVYGTIVYGFYRSFDITLATPSLSFASIEVEGLT